MNQQRQNNVKTCNDGAEKLCKPKYNLPNSHVSLKQWKMLHTVVSCGSYANAAELLHISQPAISYMVAKIEEQLGIPILKIEGRRAKVTEAGITLLARVKPLLQQATELEEFVANLRETWRPQIRLAVDESFPTRVLLPAIRAYLLDGPSAKVSLIEGCDTKIKRIMQERGAELAITGELHAGFQGNILVETEYVPVARPDHRLFTLNHPITDADINNEVQVVFNTGNDAAHKQNIFKQEGQKFWEVSNFDTAEKALTEGFGYGWLPKYLVQKSLDKGKLMVLPLEQSDRQKSSFYLVHSASSIPSSEANRLAAALQNAVASTLAPS